MARRNTSAVERIAGDILGFSPDTESEQSESVLTKYFPELTLRLPAKGARGGRLGRSQQTAEQEVKFTPKEMVQAQTPAPVDSTPKVPDYTSQFNDLKQQILTQSQELAALRGQLNKGGSAGSSAGSEGSGGSTGGTTPPTPRQQATSVITNLYKDVLGRTPDEEGLSYWLDKDPLSQGGITPEEEAQMRTSFQQSPEYNVKKLYKEELGRTPDTAGFEYWTKQDPRMSGGVDPQEYKELQQTFRQSEEYKTLASQGPKTETVQQAYKEAFGREADPEGLKYWSTVGNAPTVGGLKEALTASAKAQPTGEDPDVEGLKYWSTAGNAATDYEALKNQLLVAAGRK
jgi:hypothetical protein